MSQADQAPARVLLHIDGADPDQTLERALALRRDLMALDGVERVEPATPAGGAPALDLGVTKSVGGALSLGAWALDLLPDLLPKLIDWLKARQQRDRRVSVKLSIDGDAVEASYDPTAMTADEIEDLVARLKRQLGSAG